MSVFITKCNHLKSWIETNKNSEPNSSSIKEYLIKEYMKFVVGDRANWSSPTNILCVMVPGQTGSQKKIRRTIRFFFKRV